MLLAAESFDNIEAGRDQEDGNGQNSFKRLRGGSGSLLNRSFRVLTEDLPYPPHCPIMSHSCFHPGDPVDLQIRNNRAQPFESGRARFRPT